MFMSFAGDGIIKTKKGEKAFVRKRDRRSSSSSTATPTVSTPKPAASTKPEATPPGPPVIAPWTEAEDDILRDMKAANKSWKIIGDHLQGRDVWTMKQRWKELNAAKTSKGEGDKKDEAKPEEKKDEKEDEKKDDKKDEKKEEKKDDKKEDKKDDKKEDKTEAKKEEKKEDPPLKSALKTTKTETKADIAPKKVGDRPIIYSGPDGQCSEEDYTLLNKIHAKAEKEKWIEIASRFFDKTGKRIDVQYLKEKLANC